MDEMTLLREYADEAPLPDSAQLASVRAKLMDEIVPRRRRRFRVVGMTSVGVAAAAAVAIVVTSLSGTPRGPDAAPPPTVQSPEVLTAGAVLDYAAEAALTEPAVAPRPDQYIYLKVVTPRGYQEQWTAVDGKRPGYLVVTDPRMELFHTGPTRACGNTVHDEGLCIFASRYLAADPRTDEETMRFVIEQAFPGEPVSKENFFKPAMGMVARDLLSPSLKAAVFKALKTTAGGGRPPVVRPHEHDLAGREGIGLVWGSGPDALEMIFDAKTYAFLGDQQAAIATLKVVDHVKQR